MIINSFMTNIPADWTRSQSGKFALAKSVFLIACGTLLLAAAARIQVPVWPVRMSMQSLAVILIGMTYGARLGGVTLMAYLAEGAAGLPVFQSGAGISYFMGPTGGFLLGFLLAAILVGYLAERGALNRLPTTLATVLLAEATIYLPGLAWLAVLFGAQNSVLFGLTPFVTGELLKCAMAVALAPAIRNLWRSSLPHPR